MREKLHLTKDQYKFLISTTTNKIDKQSASKYKFKSVKEAKEAKKTIKNIHEEREKRKSYEPKKSAVDRYAERKAQLIVDYINPAHYELKVNRGDKFEINYHNEDNWNIYAKSYSRPCKVHCYEITIPYGGFKVDYTDGILMFVNKQRTINGLTVKYGEMIRKRIGKIVHNIQCVLVSNGNFSAHGNTLDDAIKQLRNKIKAHERKIKLTDIKSLDDLISAKQYQMITGACDPGTDAWLYEHGYTRKDKITVRQLLSELSDGDFGKSKLINILERNGIAIE